MVAEVKPIILMTMMSFGLACRFETKTSRTGVRCIINNDTFYASYTEEYHRCILRCMYKECLFVNYNMIEKICQLGEENCDLVLDKQYNLTSFFPPVKSCLQWIPATNIDTSHMVQSSPCNDRSSHTICYVGRLIAGPDSLPGKYHTHDGSIYTALDGQQHYRGQKEVLNVVAGCHVAWTPYIAGNVIPTRAVAGGFLSSGTGSRVFVIRRQPSMGYTVIGYYDPNTEKGYAEYYGVQVMTEMDMLVVVWLTYLCMLAILQEFSLLWLSYGYHRFAPSYWRLGWTHINHEENTAVVAAWAPFY